MRSPFECYLLFFNRFVVVLTENVSSTTVHHGTPVKFQTNEDRNRRGLGQQTCQYTFNLFYILLFRFET